MVTLFHAIRAQYAKKQCIRGIAVDISHEATRNENKEILVNRLYISRDFPISFLQPRSITCNLFHSSLTFDAYISAEREVPLLVSLTIV